MVGLRAVRCAPGMWYHWPGLGLLRDVLSKSCSEQRLASVCCHCDSGFWCICEQQSNGPLLSMVAANLMSGFYRDSAPYPCLASVTIKITRGNGKVDVTEGGLRGSQYQYAMLTRHGFEKILTFLSSLLFPPDRYNVCQSSKDCRYGSENIFPNMVTNAPAGHGEMPCNGKLLSFHASCSQPQSRCGRSRKCWS